MTLDDLAAELEDLGRARAGDRDAFARLVRRHQSAVRWQLRRLVKGDDGLADDLAQETFVQAWRHLAAFDGRARLSTWLHRIAVREFLQHRRGPGSRETLPWDEQEPPDDEAQVTADHQRVATLRLDVERALAALSEAQRLCVVHCFHLDLTHDEAAEVLGLPLGTGSPTWPARGRSCRRCWAPGPRSCHDRSR